MKLDFKQLVVGKEYWFFYIGTIAKNSRRSIQHSTKFIPLQKVLIKKRENNDSMLGMSEDIYITTSEDEELILETSSFGDISSKLLEFENNFLFCENKEVSENEYFNKLQNFITKNGYMPIMKEYLKFNKAEYAF